MFGVSISVLFPCLSQTQVCQNLPKVSFNDFLWSRHLGHDFPKIGGDTNLSIIVITRTIKGCVSSSRVPSSKWGFLLGFLGFRQHAAIIHGFTRVCVFLLWHNIAWLIWMAPIEGWQIQPHFDVRSASVWLELTNLEHKPLGPLAQYVKSLKH